MMRKDTLSIQEVKDFLDQHLYEAHSIAALCRRFSINREKLQNGFRALASCTVHSYILHRRMERAAKRLRESNDPIKSVALDSGYKKQRSFNKTFKAVYRQTPAGYRRLHQEYSQAPFITKNT